MVQARPITGLPETGRRSNGMATKVIVQHHVQDYEGWKPVFDEHGAVRRQHGATGHRIHRSLDDPNTLVIVNEFATEEGARAFAADPALKDAMQRAGVDTQPQMWFCEEVEATTY